MGKNVGSNPRNGVVDHGLPVRPCGTRGILGSHSLAAVCTGCAGGRTVLRGGLEFLTIMTGHRRSTWILDCGEGRCQ
jgi:hypothetical protein